MSPTDTQEAADALAAHRAAPDDLGRALRALRLITDIGGPDVAKEVALAFVRRHDGDERAGAAVLAFACQAPLLVFASGDALTEEGDVGAQVYVVMSGQVVVRRMGVGELAHLGPGATVGEVAGVAGTARTASVEARTPTEALCISGRALAQLQEHFSGSTELLTRSARERLLAQLIPLSSPFAELPEPEREAFYDHLTPRTVPEGTCVVREGLPSAGVYLIASGHAKALRGGDAEPPQLGPGDLFGEASQIFDGPAGADFVAVTALTLFVLSAADFRLVMLAHPKVAVRMVELSRRRMAKAGEDVPQLASWLSTTPLPTEATPTVSASAETILRCRPGSAAAAQKYR